MQSKPAPLGQCSAKATTFDARIDEATCAELCSIYKAIYDSHIREVGCHYEKANYEQAARWGMAAAVHACFAGFQGILADSSLEETLRAIGRGLPTCAFDRSACSEKKLLHVLSEAVPVGGHTRYCCRWMDGDTSSHGHNVLLTSQRQPIPEDLRKTVESRGGRLIVLNSRLPLMERARQLREIACREASAIVLHIDLHDVIPVMAFAVEEAPPVLLVNHADHLFWLGASIADGVVNIRASGEEWTRRYRGIDRCVCLPIPLQETGKNGGDGDHLLESRKSERSKLGIPPDAVVFLTIATSYKYAAMNDYGFIPAAAELLARDPKAYLLAVGPRPEGAWAAATAKTGGRLMALGVKEVVAPFHAVADVYLEGFPFGSLTSLLEAGLAGLPCIGAPVATPLPLKSDDVALNQLRNPATVEDYITEALRLAGDPDARSMEGEALRVSIRDHHTGGGWMKHLSKVYESIPQKHNIWPGIARPIPKSIRDYWVSFRIASNNVGASELLLAPYRISEAQGLRLDRCTGHRAHSELMALAVQATRLAGKNFSACEVCAMNGYHAHIERNALRLWSNCLRSCLMDAKDSRSRELAGLVLQDLIGFGATERLRAWKKRLL